MKKIFFCSVMLLANASIYAQSGFSYKDANIDNDYRTQADEAICVNKDGKVVKVLHSSDGTLTLKKYTPPDFLKYNGTSFEKPDDPHEIIALKNGGYAVAGRNFFGILAGEEDMTVTKSIGTKMLDWRALSTHTDGSTMALWKQNGAGTTGTAVDFLELAESPNGNYVCGLFLYHQWSNANQPIMRLGLAISDLTQGGKMTIHDLNLEQNGATSKKSALDVSMGVEMACLDDKHVLIGLDNASEANDYARTGFEFVVVNFAQIVAGNPLGAEVWHGKLHDFGGDISGFYVDKDGTIYYSTLGIYSGDVGAVIAMGKAKWDGTKLSSIKSKELRFESYGNVMNVANVSDDYFVLSGRSSNSSSSLTDQPFFLKVKKSDLSYGQSQIVPRSGEDYHRSFCAILDVHALDSDKQELAVLLRSKYDDTSSPGAFVLMTVTLGD